MPMHPEYWNLSRLFTPLLVAVGALAWSAAEPVAGAETPGSESEVSTARAEMKNTTGETLGHAELSNTPNGVLIHLTLTKAPVGTHAFHIHETGRCDPPSFESAGGHFNPTAAQHGFEDAKGPHAGDLANLHIPADGKLEVEVIANDTTLDTGKTSLLDGDGSALVLHATADDYQTNPAGKAGARLACGIVTR